MAIADWPRRLVAVLPVVVALIAFFSWGLLIEIGRNDEHPQMPSEIPAFVESVIVLTGIAAVALSLLALGQFRCFRQVLVVGAVIGLACGVLYASGLAFPYAVSIDSRQLKGCCPAETTIPLVFAWWAIAFAFAAIILGLAMYTIYLIWMLIRDRWIQRRI
jgi:hypothetical protein